MSAVLLDTGPLVAFLDRRDKFHAWADQQLSEIKPPLLTCEAVISEACFLLGHLPEGKRAIMQMIELKRISCPFRVQDEVSSVANLLEKYSDVPMNFADACLVRMSEQHSQAKIFTLDGDFHLYRRHGRQTIPLIFPAPD